MTPEISHAYGFPETERKKRLGKSRYDEDNLETITATAIKRPHRHFCQIMSAQPPAEFASTTALDSVATGCGTGAARGCSIIQGGVDWCVGWEGVRSDDFPRTDSPMFGKSRIVAVQYCASVRCQSGSGLNTPYLGKCFFELALLDVPGVALTSPGAFVSIGRVHGPGCNLIRHHERQQAG